MGADEILEALRIDGFLAHAEPVASRNRGDLLGSETLTQVAEASGFVVERMLEFNRIGTFAWFINGRLLRKRTFSLPQVKLLNLLVPIMRLLDPVLPTPPLSLIAILKPSAGTGAPQ